MCFPFGHARYSNQLKLCDAEQMNYYFNSEFNREQEFWFDSKTSHPSSLRNQTIDNLLLGIMFVHSQCVYVIRFLKAILKMRTKNTRGILGERVQ